PRAQAEAEMMEADAPLVEMRVAMLGRCAADRHAGASADAIEDVRRIVLDRHAERFVQQLMIKRAAGAHVADRELNMRDAVRGDHGWLLRRQHSVPSPRGGDGEFASMAALLPKADMCGVTGDVRSVPIAYISQVSLFDA